MRRIIKNDQSSLADIALLLLIFFLITTQFPKEEGIITTLPPLSFTVRDSVSQDIHIWVNANDVLMLNENPTEMYQLKNRLSALIWENPYHVRINLKSHEMSSFSIYVEVYDVVKASYKSIHEKEAQRVFKNTFEDLTPFQQHKITSDIPIKIYEGDLVKN